MSPASSRSFSVPTTAHELTRIDDTHPIQVSASLPRHASAVAHSTESARAYQEARERHALSLPAESPRRLVAVPKPVAAEPALRLMTPVSDQDVGEAESREPEEGPRGVQKLMARATARRVTPQVKPRELHPPLTALQRLRRGIAAPIRVAVVILGVVLLGAIALVVVQNPIPVYDEAVSPNSEAEEAQVSEANSHATSGGAAGAPTTANPANGARPGATIYAHVVGAVHQPGVVEIAEGARVLDALEAAGGATETAVTAHVNLARKVVDGEQIQVPDIHDPEPVASAAQDATLSHAGSSARILLNTATQAELETLPRIGPALAQRILEWRDANGGFSAVDQLAQVSGICDKLLATLSELVSV